MPRFGMKSMLVATAVVALWFSTFTFSSIIAAYIFRRSITLVFAVAAILTAAYWTGKRRAFWAGFSISMVLSSVHLGLMNLDFYGALMANRQPNPTYAFELAVFDTLATFGMLAVSLLCGFIGKYTYDQSRKFENHDR